jgi:predicted nucleic acid-binding protein
VGWVEALKGKTIGLDTAPLIYYIEEHPDYIEIIAPFFEALKRRKLRVVTSTITFMEVLVAPMKRNNSQLVTKYRTVFSNMEDLSIITITKSLAERSARIRATCNLRTPDAIQVATAMYAKADFFLTNDKRLASVPDINVLVLDDLKAQLRLEEPKTDS